MDVLKLSKPIMINGEEVKELPYDFDNMTAKDKLNAGKHMKSQGIPMSTVAELDTDYHFFLFAQAVVKANPAIDVTDVLRISAIESEKGASLARSFFYLGSGE